MPGLSGTPTSARSLEAGEQEAKALSGWPHVDTGLRPLRAATAPAWPGRLSKKQTRERLFAGEESLAGNLSASGSTQDGKRLSEGQSQICPHADSEAEFIIPGSPPPSVSSSSKLVACPLAPGRKALRRKTL